jgi:choline dehydrogenase-like flavoprotein
MKQAEHAVQTFRDIILALGGKVLGPSGSRRRISADQQIEKGGRVIHEVGGAMMGSDPKKSVTNQFGQTWDVPNIYMTDGATFCSSPDKNPTVTIMALAWRSGEHMLAEMKKGTF